MNKEIKQLQAVLFSF